MTAARDELAEDIHAIRRLLEAFADHHGICVHQWEPHNGRWLVYDRCVRCGKKRDPDGVNPLTALPTPTQPPRSTA